MKENTEQVSVKLEKQPVRVEPFNPTDTQELNYLGTINNEYQALRVQEEQHRNTLNELHRKSDEIQSTINDTSKTYLIPWGGNVMKTIRSREEKQDMLNELQTALNKMNNEYNGILGQRRHRETELGESRVKVFKIFAFKLLHEHELTIDDLHHFIQQVEEMHTRKPEELPSLVKP